MESQVLYHKMYAILCGAISDSIDFLQQGDLSKAADILQAALEEAEDLYLDAE